MSAETEPGSSDVFSTNTSSVNFVVSVFIFMCIFYSEVTCACDLKKLSFLFFQNWSLDSELDSESSADWANTVSLSYTCTFYLLPKDTKEEDGVSLLGRVTLCLRCSRLVGAVL